MAVDTEQVIRTMQRVDDFIPLMEKHIMASDVRHDDNEKRLGSLEEDRRFFKRFLILGGILWPFLYPVLKEMLLDLLFKGGSGIEAMLSFDYIIRLL